MKYVTYDNDGKLTGAFDQEISPDHDGHFIEVSDDIRLNWNEYVANVERDGVEPAPIAPPAPTPVPQSVLMVNAQLVLLSEGLLSEADAFIAGLSGPSGEEAKVLWNKSPTVRRDTPLVLGFAEFKGLSEAQIDALFIQAAAL